MAIRKIILLSLVFAFSLQVPSSRCREEGPESSVLEVQKLKEAIYSIRLVDLLDLGADQIDLVLKQSDLARPLIETYGSTLPEIYEVQRRAYTEFKREDEADREFTPQVEFFAAKASQLEKRLEEKMIGRLNKLAEPILNRLTERQVKIIDAYEPFLFEEDADLGLRDPSLRWRLDTIRETLQEAMKLADGAYARERDRLTRRIVNTLPRWNIKGGFGKTNKKGRPKKSEKEPRRVEWFENRDEAYGRIREAVDELRTVPKDKQEEAIEHVLKNKIFPTTVQQKERKLHEIHRSKHPRLTNAARFLLNPGAATYLRKMKGKPRH